MKVLDCVSGKTKINDNGKHASRCYSVQANHD